MKICFSGLHPYFGGLAPNGGSQTILKSAEVLRNLGHEVDVAATVDRFKWFEHPKPVKKIPNDADVTIAISISDVGIVMKKAPGKMAYWARPAESWQMSKDKIIKTLEKFTTRGGKIFCNSSWQITWLAQYNIPSTLQFAGIDFDRWECRGENHEAGVLLVNKLEDPIVGTLYHKHPRKQFKVAKKVMSKANAKWKLLGKGGWTTGKKLVDFYNQCQMWFAPTRLEGFHNVPVEAALCGCLIICMNEPKNGMMDYCNEDTAYICETVDDVAEVIENPDYGKVRKMNAFLRLRIGSRERNMKRFVKCLQ